MASVQDLLNGKGNKVWTIDRAATVLEAAVMMNEHKIGSLVVVDEDRIAGIFTERDVLRRVVSEQRDPSETRVCEVMTVDVYCSTPETSIEEARSVMKHRRIRHLPVVDSKRRVLGMISIGDLNAYEANAQEQTIHLLQEYLYGRV